MEPVLQNNSLQKKRYQRYSIPSARPEDVLSAQPAAQPKRAEFFYVGKKSGLIDSLIRAFESGYAAENAEQARTMLKRLALHSNTVPDVIIIEAAGNYQDLAQFRQFISAHPLLNNIPFFIESSSATADELEKIKASPFANDIIRLSDLSKERLLAKINFWKKVNQRINGIQDEQAMETVFQTQRSTAELLKRGLDIATSLILMIILCPIFLLIVLALKIESKGPVFYTSKRAGKGYKIFNFYKFRTMNTEANKHISDLSHLNIYSPLAEKGPVFIKFDNDPRVTRLGAFLRKCSLDEIPQLWNVFKGDMSLVGNRPLPLYEAVSLTTDEWAKRFIAPAGITGLWQIKKKNKFRMSAEERLDLDIRYADQSNLLFDLWIMLNTPAAVIQRTNA
ncbi:MAG TPA: sugar transferase [Flavitalea sp.]|nr:sugar transferase [Flavitalea sp.]